MFDEVIVGEAVAGEASKVKKQLENLIKSLNRSTFDVADLLWAVKKNHFYAQYGFDTMKEYVNHLDLKQRKAQYLTRISEVMEIVDIPRETYEPVGISKLREITSLDTETDYTNPKTGEVAAMKDIIRGLVIDAPQKDLTEIKEYVKVLKGLTGENELVFLNFCVKKTVRDDVINVALDLAKANIGSTGKDEDGNATDASDGRALELLCADYLSDPNNAPLEDVIE